MNSVRFLSIVGGAALLAACTSTVDQLNSVTPSGTAFTERLAVEYRDLANFEQSEMLDYRDAARYAEKGLAAAGGDAVAPYNVGDFAIPAENVDELTEARATLVSVLNGGATESHPVDAAIAQTRYDCWLEQQEENIQPDHIAACRDEFYMAIARIQGMPSDAAYFVFFDWDRSNITADAQATLEQVAADWAASGQPMINVVGHTDTSGSAAYNQGLSVRRAVSVRDALVGLGVPADMITTSGVGETQLLVQTPDGVREPSNRRAEITFQ
jgi:OOP family OmpA-OmpF porin